MKTSSRLISWWNMWHSEFPEADAKEMEDIIKAVEELEGNKTEELILA